MSDRAKARRSAQCFHRLFDQLVLVDADVPSDDPIVTKLRRVRESGGSVAETIIRAVEETGLRRRFQERDDREAIDVMVNLVELASEFDDLHPAGTLAEFMNDISNRTALSS